MEKVYETMKTSGTASIVLGILVIVAGLMSTVCGSVTIISGLNILKSKEKLTF